MGCTLHRPPSRPSPACAPTPNPLRSFPHPQELRSNTVHLDSTLEGRLLALKPLLLLSCVHVDGALGKQVLEAGGVEVETVVLPDGEEYKSLEILTKILDKALSARLDRKTTFVALGGGVIGDMVGFAAAIYQRGVKFVQVCVCVCVCVCMCFFFFASLASSALTG